MREFVTVNLEEHTPDTVLPVEDEFRERYINHVARGRDLARSQSVVIVGMARNIGSTLPHTIRRLEAIGECFDWWRAVVVENDSEDDTKDVLRTWEDNRCPHVVANCRDLQREHLHGFERQRVERYAEYRQRYIDIAKYNWPHANYVLAVDLDPLGGYSLEGVMSSVYWHSVLPAAGGMASTSLYQARTQDGKAVWCHYDQWAFRQWTWKPRWDPYFIHWLPPVGVRPIPVRSAFGACVLYKSQAIYGSQIASDAGDIEHVGLHRRMRQHGWRMYLNPASRVVMHWQVPT